MMSLLRERITVVWLLLVAATVASWELGHGVGFKDIRYASVAILVVAFIKVRLVILDFMEIRKAPPLIRAVAEGWIVAVCSALVVLYWQSTNGNIAAS